MIYIYTYICTYGGSRAESSGFWRLVLCKIAPKILIIENKTRKWTQSSMENGREWLLLSRGWRGRKWRHGQGGTGRSEKLKPKPKPIAGFGFDPFSHGGVGAQPRRRATKINGKQEELHSGGLMEREEVVGDRVELRGSELFGSPLTQPNPFFNLFLNSYFGN